MENIIWENKIFHMLFCACDLVLRIDTLNVGFKECCMYDVSQAYQRFSNVISD